MPIRDVILGNRLRLGVILVSVGLRVMHWRPFVARK